MSIDEKSTYYDAGGIETIDIIKAKLTKEQWLGYLLGNQIKYTCRMMHKTPNAPERDCEKTNLYGKLLEEELKDSEMVETKKPVSIKQTEETELLRDIAKVAHRGALHGYDTDAKALVKIRKLSLPWFTQGNKP